MLLIFMYVSNHPLVEDGTPLEAGALRARPFRLSRGVTLETVGLAIRASRATCLLAGHVARAAEGPSLGPWGRTHLGETLATAGVFPPPTRAFAFPEANIVVFSPNNNPSKSHEIGETGGAPQGSFARRSLALPWPFFSRVAS